MNGIDIFIEPTNDPLSIGHTIKNAISDKLQLTTICNRGTHVYPTGSVYTECINQYRIRLELKEGSSSLTQEEAFDVCKQAGKFFRIGSLEMLMEYNGQKAYSLAQGQ